MTNEGILDIEGLKTLIEHVINGGVHGIFILGTTGEGPSLNYNIRREMIEKSSEFVHQRIPLLVGITDTSLSESVDLATFAELNGANAVVVAPPFYFNIGDNEFVNYIHQLANESPLPLFLYNMPALTRFNIPISVIKILLKHENIIGVKDSSGNMDYYSKLCQASGSYPVFNGPEELLAESLKKGGHGGVCGGANLFPKLYVGLYNAFKASDDTLVQEYHEKIMIVSDSLYHIGEGDGQFIRGLKCALFELNICNDYTALPYRKFEGNDRELIKQKLQFVLKNI